MTFCIETSDSVGVPGIENTAPRWEYADAKIQRAACYAFATLAGLGAAGIAAVAYFGVFEISILWAAPLVAIAGGSIYFGLKILDLRDECALSRFDEMVQKHGLETLLRTFSIVELKQKFDQEIQDPKTTFCSILQAYDLQLLLHHKIIDQQHFALLQNLKKRAEAYSDIYFPPKYQSRGSGTYEKKKRVLTLFAKAHEAFKAVIGMDREYKQALGLSSPIPTIDLKGIATPTIETKKPTYIDARIKRAVCYAFAALTIIATLGIAAIAHFAVFKISMGYVSLPLAAAIIAIYFASKVIDYKDGEVQSRLRTEFTNSNFMNLYQEHGLSNLFQVFKVEELKEKFNQEISDPKTTFWNVLRRYDIQKLCVAGIITPQHLVLLMDLAQKCAPLNLAVHLNKRPHILTAFATEPEAFRIAEALDMAYKNLNSVS